MFIQVFANYLYETKVIEKAQFDLVINHAKHEKLLLGQVAHNIGLMTPEQILEIKRLQAGSDALFGQIALSVGYLTQEEIDILLRLQSKNDLIVIKILTENDILDLTSVLENFEKFREFYNLSEPEFDLVVENNIPVCLKKLSGIDENYGIFFDFSNLFVKMLVRFIDRDCLPKKAYSQESFFNEFIVSQLAIGDSSYTIGYTASEHTLHLIANAYATIDFDSLEGTAIDALGEFLNCITGLFVSELDKLKDIELELQSPVFNKNATLDHVQLLPIETHYGEIKIFLQKNS